MSMLLLTFWIYNYLRRNFCITSNERKRKDTIWSNEKNGNVPFEGDPISE